MRHAVAFLFVAGLTGCALREPTHPAPATADLTPVREASTKADEAARKAEEASRRAEAERSKRESKAAAAVGAAAVANGRNPDGPPKDAVAGELGEAARWLPTASGDDAAEAMRRINLVLTGQRDEARAAYAKSDAERLASNAAAAKAATERESALRERDAARQEARDAVAKAQADADARVNAYKLESEGRIREANANAERVIREANARAVRLIFFPIAGVLALAAFAFAGLAWVRDSVHLWAMAGIALGLSIVACAVPIAITSGWFLWVAGGITLALLGCIPVVILRANRVKRDADATAADNELAARALRQVVTGVQTAKAAVPDAARSVLSHVEDAVGPEVRDLIRRIKSAA